MHKSKIAHFLFAASFSIFCFSSLQAHEKHPRVFKRVLSPIAHQTRPLAFYEHGGWLLAGNLLVGEYDSAWIVGYNADNLTPVWWLPNRKGGLSTKSIALGNSILLSFRDGSLVRVNLESGEELWHINLDSFVDRPITVHESELIVVTASKLLYSINSETGKILWVNSEGKSSSMFLANSSAPIIYNGEIYWGNNNEILCLSLDKGAVKWKSSFNSTQKKLAGLVGDMIISEHSLFYTDTNGVVGELSLLTHRSESILPAHQITDISTSLFRSGNYILGSSDGTILNIDTQTHKTLWQVNIGQPIAHLFASETTLYAYSSSGYIFVLSLQQGSLLWSDNLGVIPTYEPIFPEKDPHVFYVAAGGHLFGYRRSNTRY